MRKLLIGLHSLGFLALVATAALYYAPEDRLPKSAAKIQKQAREAVTSQAARLFAPGLEAEANNRKVVLRQVKEEFEDRVAELKQRRGELQDQLKKTGAKS
jgi:hypothetical protein